MKKTATTLLLGVCVLLATLAQQPAAASRGYSLALNKPTSLVALKKGFVDFDDPGMSQLESEISVAVWMRAYARSRAAMQFSFQWVNELNENLLQPFIMVTPPRKDFFYLNVLEYDDALSPDVREWHHCGFTLNADGVATVYMNGEAVGQLDLGETKSVRGPRTFMGIGGHVYHSAAAVEPQLNEAGSVLLEIDDLSVWSRALSQEEIRALMNAPLDVSALPVDAVLAYTFDVDHCAQTPDDNAECGIDQDIVRNYGSAGREYDLLRGLLNYAPGGPSRLYRSVFDAPDEPATRLIQKPVLHRSTAPLSAEAFNPAAPTVLEAALGDAIDVSLLAFGTFTAVSLSATPSNGTTLMVIDGSGFASPAALGTSLAGAQALRVQLPMTDELAASGSSSSSHATWRFALELEPSGGGPRVAHDVHVLPLLRPELDANPLELNGVEDGELSLIAVRVGAVPSGERATAILAKAPTFGSVYNVGWESLDKLGEPLASGDAIEDVGGDLIYVPQADVSGLNVDQFELVFRSERSGLESEPLLVRLNLLPRDDLPVGAPAVARVVEDSADGVRISLEASDAEGKAGLVITQLPRHGRLFASYAMGGQPAQDREITKPFELFDVGEEFVQQYVHKVRAVSSYWGTGLNSGYHAVNVIGSGRCARQGQSECYLDDRFSGSKPAPILVNDQVRGKITLLEGAQGDPTTTIFFRVTAVHNKDGTTDSDLDATFDLVEEPLYRHQYDAKGQLHYVRCRLERMEYPAGCAIQPADAPLLEAHDVPRDALLPISTGVWCPRFRNPSTDATFRSTEASEMMGPEYATEHNAAVPYFQLNMTRPTLRPYTEFIEVEYLEPVFPVSVQVGQPRGPGTIVAIYALRPGTEDDWVLTFSGAPQVTQGAEAVSRQDYHVFQENQCRESFRTSALRLELDTVAIPDWNYIDYIKLSGTKEVQSAVLMDGVTEVRYVPNADAFGEDTFAYAVTDCGGDELRQSPDNVVTVQIEPQPDAPVASVSPSAEVYSYSQNSFFRETQDRVHFELVGADADAERLTIAWASLPTLGVVYVANASVPLSASSDKLVAAATVAGAGEPLRAMLSFEPMRCTERGLEKPGSPGEWTFAASDEMRFTVSDSNGASTEQMVNFTVVCEDYSYDFSIDTAAIALALFNVTCALVCIGWAVVKRGHAIVKAAQLPFLLLIALGCIISSCSILPLAIHDQAGPRAGPQGGNPTADNACRLSASLFMMGFMLSFSSLFAKMYRVYRVFGILISSSSSRNSTSKKRAAGGKLHVKVSTGTILRIIGAFCAVELALVAAWFGTDPLRFHRDVTLRDPHGNALHSVGFCYSRNSDFFLAVTCLYHLSVLFMGAWLCYKTMGVSSAFSEAKYVSVAIIGNLEVLLIAIPVLLIVSDSPSSSVFVQAGVIALNDLGALACIFLPKVIFQITGHIEEGHGATVLQTSSTVKKSDSRSASVAPGEASAQPMSTAN